MIELVFFGRGGQGAVTAAQVLATAAFREGKYSQAFPSFGPERRGAPVTAYARIDETPIVDRSQVDRADYLMVLDPKVLKTANPLKMLRKNGIKADWDLLRRGVSKSLKYASSINAKYAIFIGEEEVNQNSVTIKDLKTGKQEFVKISNLVKLFK